MVRHPPELLTLADAGKRFGLSPTTLRVLIHKGRLKGRKLGRDLWVAPADVRAYLKGRAPQGRRPSPEQEEER